MPEATATFEVRRHGRASVVDIRVEGRRLTSPIQGFGRMWQKTYQVRLPAERVAPADLIATWKQRFPEFWPEGGPSTDR